jgi:uncharacterized lipoprotein
MKKIFVLWLFVLFLAGCSSVVNTEKANLNLKNKTLVVLPFENYTETPLAGLRIASIAYAVLNSKEYIARNFVINSNFQFK